MAPGTPREPMTLAELAGTEGLIEEDERLVQEAVRRFVRERYLPRAAELFASETFPRDLVPEMAALGLYGGFIHGHGCAGMSTVAYGLALEELEYGDSALRSFVSVQSSLAMNAIHRYGSEEQQRRWLPAMQRGELVGCFGLTEPDSGSDPGSMRTRARADGASFVLRGAKTWITNAPIADLAVVWAKLEDERGGGDPGPDAIRGFVVERGTPGLATPAIAGKMSLRASPTGEIVLDDCRVPAENLLAGARGLLGPLGCLNHARLGIAFGALGAARACYESAVDYARSRVQFGVPIASKQLVQDKLVRVASAIVQGKLMALHFARLADQRRLAPQQPSLAKKANVAAALEAARVARGVLGANGILLAYPAVRHMLNLESVSTYEGTDEVHTLILGRALTGHDAF
jgi:glutaryl-CoA dehydrogenase